MVKQGRITEAMATFTKAAQLMPCAQRHTIWQAFYGNRDTAVTLVAYREALRRRPQWPQAANNLASADYASHPIAHDITEAVALAEQACAGTDFRHPLALRTLACLSCCRAESGGSPCSPTSLGHINLSMTLAGSLHSSTAA